MPQIINTNIASLNAQRNLNSSQASTNQALERLSSGLRINSAKDDAAGLAISTRFQSQINGLNVAIRNVGDGVSLSQTAEGALGAMTDSLQRIRELALQSANGTNSDADRQALNSETQQLIAEITRAGSQTNFNGLNLLDGSFSSVFQVGANSGETISVNIAKLTADTLGVSTKSGVTTTATTSALSSGDLVINGTTIGASRASDDSASTANIAASAIAKAAAVNRASGSTGVTALVDKNIAAGSSLTAGAASGSVTINGTTISVDTTNQGASTRSAVVSAINAQSSLTGVTAIDSGDDALGVSLEAADGRNIAVSFTTLTAANTGLADTGTYTGGITLVAGSNTSSINITGSNLANAGVAKGSYTAGVASLSSVARAAQAGDAAILTGSVNVGTVFDGVTGYDFSEVQTVGTTATLTGASTFAEGAALDFSLAATSGAQTGSGTVLAGFTFDFGAVAASTSGAAAVVTGTQAIEGITFNFSPVAFTVNNGISDYNVVLDEDYADTTAILADINTSISGSGFTATLSGGATGNLIFTETNTVKLGNQVTISDTVNGSGDSTIIGFTDGQASTSGVADTIEEESFGIKVDGAATATTITLNQSVTGRADLLNQLNTQLNAIGATATAVADKIVITSNATGTSSSIEITAYSGADDGDKLDLAVAAATSGVAGGDTKFDITYGGTTKTITLDGDYQGSAGVDLQTAINDQLTAGTALGVTATVTDGGGGAYTLSFAEDVNLGQALTFANNATGSLVDAASILKVTNGATDTGTAAVAESTNAAFTLTIDGVSAGIDINTDQTGSTAATLVGLINTQIGAGALDGLATAFVDGSGQINIRSNSSGTSSQVKIAASTNDANTVLGLTDLEDFGAAGANSVANLSDGDLVINGVSIGAAKAADDTASFSDAISSSKQASGISVAAAINRASSSTGVTASVNATEVVGSAAVFGSTGTTGTVYVNGVSVGLTEQTNADANRAQAVNQINSVSGQTGVIAEDNGSSLTLTATDGRNIVLAFDTAGGATATNFGLAGTAISSNNFTTESVTDAGDVAVTTYSTVTLKSAGKIDVSGGTNGNTALESLGLQQGSFGGGVSGQFLTQVDISTQDGANAALAAVDNALNAVNSARADLGAIQNRFETTISNLAVTSENLSAANSRILDADFAAEAAALSRSQILQQAGISILSQANAAPQQVLSLLQ